MDAKTLGKRIHKIRINNGMTMAEFINLIDGTQHYKRFSGTVNNWEHGLNMPNKRRLKKIADLAGTTVSEILSEE